MLVICTAKYIATVDSSATFNVTVLWYQRHAVVQAFSLCFDMAVAQQCSSSIIRIGPISHLSDLVFSCSYLSLLEMCFFNGN